MPVPSGPTMYIHHWTGQTLENSSKNSPGLGGPGGPGMHIRARVRGAAGEPQTRLSRKLFGPKSPDQSDQSGFSITSVPYAMTVLGPQRTGRTTPALRSGWSGWSRSNRWSDGFGGGTKGGPSRPLYGPLAASSSPSSGSQGSASWGRLSLSANARRAVGASPTRKP